MEEEGSKKRLRIIRGGKKECERNEKKK